MTQHVIGNIAAIDGVGGLSAMHWCCCLAQGGQPVCALAGPAAPQESKVCGRGEVEPPAASTDVPRARFGAASDCKSLLCSSFEQFGAAALRDASRMGERAPDARRALGCGTLGPGFRAGSLAKVSAAGAPLAARRRASIRGQRRDAAIYSEAALGHARAALARRRAGGLPPRRASCRRRRCAASDTRRCPRADGGSTMPY